MKVATWASGHVDSAKVFDRCFETLPDSSPALDQALTACATTNQSGFLKSRVYAKLAEAFDFGTLSDF
jgi:hypothetical protein